jgi:hypothetical protein
MGSAKAAEAAAARDRGSRRADSVKAVCADGTAYGAVESPQASRDTWGAYSPRAGSGIRCASPVLPTVVQEDAASYGQLVLDEYAVAPRCNVDRAIRDAVEGQVFCIYVREKNAIGVKRNVSISAATAPERTLNTSWSERHD